MMIPEILLGSIPYLGFMTANAPKCPAECPVIKLRLDYPYVAIQSIGLQQQFVWHSIIVRIWT
jgi:hypothetical protein